MATPIELPGMMLVKAPEGSDIPPLPAYVKDGVITSVWKLDPAELASILATGAIGVVMHGRQPPMSLTALSIEQPPDHPGFYVRPDEAIGYDVETLQQAFTAALEHFSAGGEQFTIMALGTPHPGRCAARAPRADSEPNTCRLAKGHHGPHEYV